MYVANPLSLDANDTDRAKTQLVQNVDMSLEDAKELQELLMNWTTVCTNNLGHTKVVAFPQAGRGRRRSE